MRGGALLLAVLMLAGCGDGGSDVEVEDRPLEALVVSLGSVSLDALNQGQTFDVVAGGSGMAIVADAGDASDIDIDLLQSPSGRLLVSDDPDDANALTGNAVPQAIGASVATAIVPSGATTPLETGTYTFSLASFESRAIPFTILEPATVTLTAIINTRADPQVGTLPLNVYFVGTDDVDAGNALTKHSFRTVMNVVERIFGAANLRVTVALHDVTGDEAARLSLLDVLIPGVSDRTVPDVNLNRQSDEMDELFRLSRNVGNRGLNVFFVDEFNGAPGVLGVSGGNPGPPVIQGTAHSGIAISTRGGLEVQSDGDLEILGTTVAHEIGHYLGLFDRSGDPQNLMFPTITSSVAGTLTPDQAYVLLRNPAVVE